MTADAVLEALRALRLDYRPDLRQPDGAWIACCPLCPAGDETLHIQESRRGARARLDCRRRCPPGSIRERARRSALAPRPRRRAADRRRGTHGRSLGDARGRPATQRERASACCPRAEGRGVSDPARVAAMLGHAVDLLALDTSEPRPWTPGARRITRPGLRSIWFGARGSGKSLAGAAARRTGY